MPAAVTRPRPARAIRTAGLIPRPCLWGPQVHTAHLNTSTNIQFFTGYDSQLGMNVLSFRGTVAKSIRNCVLILARAMRLLTVHAPPCNRD